LDVLLIKYHAIDIHCIQKLLDLLELFTSFCSKERSGVPGELFPQLML
jgi:hypothetical protein